MRLALIAAACLMLAGCIREDSDACHKAGGVIVRTLNPYGYACVKQIAYDPR